MDDWNTVQLRQVVKCGERLILDGKPAVACYYDVLVDAILSMDMDECIYGYTLNERERENVFCVQKQSFACSNIILIGGFGNIVKLCWLVAEEPSEDHDRVSQFVIDYLSDWDVLTNDLIAIQAENVKRSFELTKEERQQIYQVQKHDNDVDEIRRFLEEMSKTLVFGLNIEAMMHDDSLIDQILKTVYYESDSEKIHVDKR